MSRTHFIRVSLLLVCVLHCCLWNVAVRAQGLKFAVQSEKSRLRSQAPIPVDVMLSWNGSRILEGHLELLLSDRAIMDDGLFAPSSHIRSPELALTTGDRKFGLLLPPQRVTNSDGVLVIRARFVTSQDGQVIELGDHDLLLPKGCDLRDAGKRRKFGGYSGTDGLKPN